MTGKITALPGFYNDSGNTTFTIIPDYFLKDLNIKQSFALRLLIRHDEMKIPFSITEQSKFLGIKFETLLSWLEQLDSKGYIKINRKSNETHDYDLIKQPLPTFKEETIDDIIGMDYPEEFKSFIKELLSYFKMNKGDNRVVIPTKTSLNDALPDAFIYWKKGKQYHRALRWYNLFEYLLSTYCEKWMEKGMLTMSGLVRYIPKHWERAQAIDIYGQYVKRLKREKDEELQKTLSPPNMTSKQKDAWRNTIAKIKESLTP